MSYVPTYQQDVLRGNFPPIEYKRHMPVRGPSGLFIWVVAVSCISWGWYKLIQRKRELRDLDDEKRLRRIKLLPYLQAEADRIYLKERELRVEEARTVMGDDWKPKRPTRKWMPTLFT